MKKVSTQISQHACHMNRLALTSRKPLGLNPNLCAKLCAPKKEILANKTQVITENACETNVDAKWKTAMRVIGSPKTNESFLVSLFNLLLEVHYFSSELLLCLKCLV